MAVRHRARRRKRNPANPKRRHRTRRGLFAKVRHVRARRYARNAPRRRSRRSSGLGLPGFLSGRFLKDAGFGALGAVAPTLFTDKVLPMVGLTLAGIPRRLAQLALPTAILYLGGKKLLGTGAYAFTIGAYAITVLGLVNDLTGGIATISGAPALGDGMGHYQVSGPGLGLYEDAASVGYAS